jgi:hypothetical protein
MMPTRTGPFFIDDLFLERKRKTNGSALLNKLRRRLDIGHRSRVAIVQTIRYVSDVAVPDDCRVLGKRLSKVPSDGKTGSYALLDTTAVL